MVPKEFWTPTPIKPQPLLAQLRALVFAQSENRSPKWKFRAAPDLVLQIQAKLSAKHAEKFECSAVQCAGADVDLLTMRRIDLHKTKADWQLRFDLYALPDATWHFRPRSITSKPTGGVEFCRRVIDAFENGHFDRLRPSMMLGHYCLCCGKGLTDPVSMARGIGPECWGSASPVMPFISDLMKEDPPPPKETKRGLSSPRSPNAAR
jgi:uncharacterized protein DUF6011